MCLTIREIDTLLVRDKQAGYKDVELLYNEFKEKGVFEQNAKFKYEPCETVGIGMVVAIDNKGREITGIKIHYSSTSVHLAPWKGDSNDFE